MPGTSSTKQKNQEDYNDGFTVNDTMTVDYKIGFRFQLSLSLGLFCLTV